MPAACSWSLLSGPLTCRGKATAASLLHPPLNRRNRYTGLLGYLLRGVTGPARESGIGPGDLGVELVGPLPVGRDVDERVGTREESEPCRAAQCGRHLAERRNEALSRLGEGGRRSAGEGPHDRRQVRRVDDLLALPERERAEPRGRHDDEMELGDDDPATLRLEPDPDVAFGARA